MKRIRLLFIFIFLISGCLGVLCSCEKTPPLKAPERVEVDQDTLTLEWSEVKGARLYVVRISAEGKEPLEVSRSTLSYGLDFLEEGVYSVEVKALGKENESGDSAWSEAIPFVRERECGLVFTLTSDGKSYAVVSKGDASGDIVIPDTYRDKPVTEIGEKAFFNKSDVTSVTMGKNVQKVGNMAFANCSYLERVNFSDALTSLGENAFASCRSLAGDLVIPEGVTEISTGVFSYCGSINSVTLGSNVHTIGINAFANCNSLISIVIPDSVTTVKGYAFALYSSLSDVSFGAGVEHIEEYAFSSLPITSVTLPAGLQTIGVGAFHDCQNLASVSLGDEIVEINVGAFADTAIWSRGEDNEVYVGGWLLGLKDTSVNYVDFREGTVGIANAAFYANRNLTDLILPDSVRYIGKRAFACSKIINMVIGGGVEKIGEEAFAACKSLATMILGSYDFNNAVMVASNLCEIENNAFYACEKLDAIKIPASVRCIGSYAFKESGIEAMADGGLVYADRWLVGYTDDFGGFAQVRSGTVGICNYAFYDCSALREVSLPSSLEVLGRGAFYQCVSLAAVRMPDTLEVIEDYTFYGCESYHVTSLPSMLKRIGKSAFYKCGSALSLLEREGEESDEDVLVIPSTVESIGDYAFYGCGEAVISENGELTYFGVDAVEINGSGDIGDYAFYQFASLKYAVVGEGIVSVGDKAFYRCERLESVSFGDGLTDIGSKAFHKSVALTDVVLPDSLETIGDYAFYQCEKLASPLQCVGLTSIGDGAFSGCASLSVMVLPEGLTTIGRQAFRGCVGLTSVALHGGIETIGEHAFYGCSHLTVYAGLSRAPESWDEYWNSSYRPILWNCTLSEDCAYVLSFEKNASAIQNKNATNELASPVRAGYTFAGWDTNSAAETGTYETHELTEVSDGRKLFAIWVQNDQE